MSTSDERRGMADMANLHDDPQAAAIRALVGAVPQDDPQVKLVRAGFDHLENELAELKRFREREPLVQALLDAWRAVSLGLGGYDVASAAMKAVREFKIGTSDGRTSG